MDLDAAPAPWRPRAGDPPVSRTPPVPADPPGVGARGTPLPPQRRPRGAAEQEHRNGESRQESPPQGPALPRRGAPSGPCPARGTPRRGALAGAGSRSTSRREGSIHLHGTSARRAPPGGRRQSKNAPARSGGQGRGRRDRWNDRRDSWRPPAGAGRRGRRSWPGAGGSGPRLVQTLLPGRPRTGSTAVGPLRTHHGRGGAPARWGMKRATVRPLDRVDAEAIRARFGLRDGTDGPAEVP